MITAIIGRKLDMTQIFSDDGTVYPVTLVQAGPCTVTQVKTPEKDGYCALQMGFGPKKAKNVNRPIKGHLDKAGKGYFEVLREVAAENPAQVRQVRVARDDDGLRLALGGIPVVVENDANVAAYAEYRLGAGRGDRASDSQPEPAA